MSKTAIVLGATGLIGRHVINYLLADERYHKVKVFTRRNTGVLNAKLEETIIDFEDLQNYAKDFGADDLFCCLGTTMKKAGNKDNFIRYDSEYVVNAASLAKQAGVKRFIWVSAAASRLNSPSFHLRVKAEMDEQIKKLKFPFFKAVKPSLLLGKREEFRLGESIGTFFFKPVSRLLLGPLKKYRAIRGDEVAQAMINLANDKPVHPYLEVWPGK